MASTKGAGKQKPSSNHFVLETSLLLPGKADSTAPRTGGFSSLFDEEEAGTTSAEVRLNPRAMKFVEDYMDKHGEDLLEMKDWGRPYFNMMDGVLAKYGLPTELKYLAVIESKLKRTAVSWAGAVGPWQFMPGTARLLGLKVARGKDERTDFYKSTHAAAKYLRDLYTEFGDWLLVIAAYNGGPGNVYSAIKKSGSRNFWDLQYYLPAESRTHVKKFIGTHYVFEGQGGITTLTKEEAKEQMGVTATYLLNRKLSTEELSASKSLTISGKYHSSCIARHVLMDINTFNRYNPDFDKKMASADNAYELKLPSEKMDLFMANKYNILNESVQMLLSGSSVSNQVK
ncbi:lytic transglycosylase domain-containing protein [Pseudoflavitalea sp. G-6-1-2]|uniref:lytic transglycosylase domain-containing protein n=1 Tax=Pseudoflavitalea sp. G-6-1-2 TaxID=2728841 RepID=UPI001469DF41|nr:lytic transglycosylase domain-containing protein [Pseudoflavitalea sp. G-6-1-2]NML20577.1 lytic transglycosylase domain-containing protein [Pseudoflavitalea sp. G-6-1-2]